MDIVWVGDINNDWGELSSAYHSLMTIDNKNYISVDDYWLSEKMDNYLWKYREVWIMRVANINKFLQNGRLCEVLLETGDREIICEFGEWSTSNLLGTILVEIRDILLGKVTLSLACDDRYYLNLINKNFFIGNFDMSFTQCVGPTVIVDLSENPISFPILDGIHVLTRRDFSIEMIVKIVASSINYNRCCYIYGSDEEYKTFFIEYITIALKLPVRISRELTMNIMNNVSQAKSLC